jgi:hypothetical protein
VPIILLTIKKGNKWIFISRICKHKQKIRHLIGQSAITWPFSENRESDRQFDDLAISSGVIALSALMLCLVIFSFIFSFSQHHLKHYYLTLFGTTISFSGSQCHWQRQWRARVRSKHPRTYYWQCGTALWLQSWHSCYSYLNNIVCPYRSMDKPSMSQDNWPGNNQPSNINQVQSAPLS